MQASTPLFKTTVQGASQTVAHSVSLTLPLTRTNLCPNPSFEVSAANWTAQGGTTLTQSTDRAVVGTHSLKLTFGNAPGGTNVASYTIPTKIGTIYTVSCQAWSVTGVSPLQIMTGLPGETTQPATSAGAWQQTYSTFTANQTTTTVYIRNTVTVASGQVAYVDAVLAEQTGQVGTYFDGSFPDASWQGATGLSPSIINVAFAAPLTRTNLCTNPSFETGTTGWAANGTAPPTLTQSSTPPAPAPTGTQVLKLTYQNGTSGGFNGAKITFTSVVGTRYTMSAWVYVPTGAAPISLLAAGVGFGNTNAAVGFDQWVRITHSFIAASTTTTIQTWAAGTQTAGQVSYVDAVLIEASPTLNSYFDGTFTNAYWTGTIGASTSILALTAYSDVGLAVESISVDRQLTTDMPDGTRLITGYPAASATVTLSGLVDQTDASKTVAWLLNPANPDSPMYRLDALGAPIQIQAGLYLPGSATPEQYPIFTGTVDDYTVDVQGGTVTLSCLDYRSKFTSVPTLPFGVFSASSPTLGTGPQLLTPGWVLNALCEAIGRYTSPPPRASVLFRQTNHGGAWPETGPAAAVVVGSNTGNTASVPGVFASQVPHDSFASYYNTPPSGQPIGTVPGDIGTSGNSWFTECWVQPTTDPGIVTPNYATCLVLLGVNSGGSDIQEIIMGTQAATLGSALTPSVAVSRGAGTVTVTPASLTVPNDGAWHYLSVAFHFTSTTGFTATFTVDGASQTATGTLAGAGNGSNPIVEMNVFHNCPAESIQVTNETGTPASNFGFVPDPGVAIGPSLNQLTAVPDVSGQDAWGVIQQIAEAEGGIVGFDETGTFRFVNRQTLRQQGDQRAITPTYSLKTLDQEMGLSFVRNHVQLPVNALAVQPPGTVWDTGSTIHPVNANSTLTLYATTDNPVTQVDTIGDVMPSGGGTPGLSYYRACTAPNGRGPSRTNLTMLVQQSGPTTLIIRVSNPNNQPVWLVSPTDPAFPSTSIGVPVLRVGGINITPLAVPTESGGSASGTLVADAQWPPLNPDGTGGAVTNNRGELLLMLDSNPFVQDTGTAQTYATDIVTDLYQPRPLWRRTAIVTDPSLQLADQVLVQDPDTTLVDGSALIIGVHTTVSRTDWNQNLDLRSTGTPGGWVMGVAGKSEISSTTFI